MCIFGSLNQSPKFNLFVFANYFYPNFIFSLNFSFQKNVSFLKFQFQGDSIFPLIEPFKEKSAGFGGKINKNCNPTSFYL